jgi:precorrin-6A/cobalt-precorrin-6A reductase
VTESGGEGEPANRSGRGSDDDGASARHLFHLLILGGTGEAAALAGTALTRHAGRIAVTTSLAGRTERPGAVPGEVRIGGFGGPDGLADYLRMAGVDAVIDATHPFAAQMSTHARLACEGAGGVPRLQLYRSAWERHPLDHWIEVDSLADAASIVGKIGRRAWLTVGAGEVDAFAAVEDVRFLVRLIDPPRRKLPLKFHEIVIRRGPFTLAEERHLLHRHAIEVLVCKASGGDATAAKLAAAREIGLPVIMVRRPPAEPGETVETVEAALRWLDARLTEFRSSAFIER